MRMRLLIFFFCSKLNESLPTNMDILTYFIKFTSNVFIDPHLLERCNDVAYQFLMFSFCFNQIKTIPREQNKCYQYIKGNFNQFFQS